MLIWICLVLSYLQNPNKNLMAITQFRCIVCKLAFQSTQQHFGMLNLCRQKNSWGSLPQLIIACEITGIVLPFWVHQFSVGCWVGAFWWLCWWHGNGFTFLVMRTVISCRIFKCCSLIFFDEIDYCWRVFINIICRRKKILEACIQFLQWNYVREANLGF